MPAVMLYVQHLLGIGHLMRSRSIAAALADAGFRVHLVSGGMPVGGPVPRGVDMVQLPPICAAGASLKPLRDAAGDPIDDTYREQRRDLLLAAFESIAPAVVLFETYPFGRRALRFELVPLLERIASRHPRPLVVASVRDILQVRQKVEREQEMLDAANRWFDAVLVHGDVRFARFEATFPLAPELKPQVHYTGFVRPRDDPPPALQTTGRHEVVVSAGGGAVGMDLLRAALAAKQHSRFGAMRWRVLVGTNVSDADYRGLLREAGSDAVVERARVDFAALLQRALISVSQAGYNTVLDVLTSGARAVFVPFTANGETEQRTRANRIRELELGIVVEDTDLSPATLAAAIDAAGSRDHWGRWDFACDGAARSAALIAAMVGIDLAPRVEIPT